jgi:hypothetical protein
VPPKLRELARQRVGGRLHHDDGHAVARVFDHRLAQRPIQLGDAPLDGGQVVAPAGPLGRLRQVSSAMAASLPCSVSSARTSDHTRSSIRSAWRRGHPQLSHSPPQT